MTRVLNVNDRDIPRYLNEEMLRREGFEVVSAGTGCEAIELSKHGDFDVALLDVQLPDQDGFHVCKVLRAAPETANIIVLMTSAAFVTSKNKIAGLEAGADGYLVQPFETAELVATLRALVRAREAERRASLLAKQLQSAMDVRDQFLAMLGHELRNPIGSITNALHLLHEKREPAAFEHYHAILARQTRNLSHIVDDLLDVARITQGKVSLARSLVDLREVVRRCVDSTAEDIRASQHELGLDLPAGPVRVIGDAVRLEQIVCNLVTNANKYTPPGGHLRVRLTAKATHAVVEVIDDGIGMDSAMRDRVFDVFVQGKQTIDRSRGGLGLGLTVVRELVALHEGNVAAFSDGEGKGSRFVVELPLAPADAVAEPSPAEPPAGEQLHIVVIEDNEDARITLEEALGTFHHEVATAGDGISGLELVLASAPDVALVDIGLPGIDGYEVARKIHERMNVGAPKLIAMTGYGQPEDRARAEQAGFDLHIVKPVVLKKLQQVLATIHRRQRS